VEKCELLGNLLNFRSHSGDTQHLFLLGLSPQLNCGAYTALVSWEKHTSSNPVSVFPWHFFVSNFINFFMLLFGEKKDSKLLQFRSRTC